MKAKISPRIRWKSIPINITSPFTKVTIRNGWLWGINKNRLLISVNLMGAKHNVKTYLHIGECLFYSVSPNGEFCFVQGRQPPKPGAEKPSPKVHYIIDSTRESRIINLDPGNIATAAAWLILQNPRRSVLFLTTDQKRLYYFDSISSFKSCFPISNINIPGEVRLFSLLQHIDKRIVISFLINNQIYPFILDEYFTPIKDNQRSTALPPCDCYANVPHFFENNYIAFLTQDLFMCIAQDPTIPDINISKVHKTILHFNIDRETEKFCISHNVIFQFKRNEISFFSISADNCEDPIGSLTLNNAKMFELDTYTSTLFSITDNIVTQYKFETELPSRGFAAIRNWIALAFGNKIPAPSFCVQVIATHFSNFRDLLQFLKTKNDNFKIEVLKKFIDQINPEYKTHQQSIAILTLDLYIRYETKESKSLTEKESQDRIKSFIQWVSLMIKRNVLTSHIVEKALIEYDWNSALSEFLEPPAEFNLKMSLGLFQEANDQLKKIRREDIFSKAAIRLFPSLPDEVCDSVTERDDALSGQLIPIIISDRYQPHLKQLFSSGCLTNHWLRTIFSLYMAKHPDPLAINQYFKFHNFDIEIMVRSLFSEKRYIEAAQGITYMDNDNLLSTAVAIASYKSPSAAFGLIKESAPASLKRRCALRILRTMKRDDAEAFAKHNLLESFKGIDPTTLIEFLPNSAKVEELSKVIFTYSQKQQTMEKEENKKQAEALKGISLSNDLDQNRIPETIRLFKLDACSKCGRPLLNEPGIVYPCSHKLHMRCAKSLFDDLPYNPISSHSVNANEKLDLDADCPLCGFLCIGMMSEPFEPNRNPSQDRWSTDPSVLSNLL